MYRQFIDSVAFVNYKCCTCLRPLYLYFPDTPRLCIYIYIYLCCFYSYIVVYCTLIVHGVAQGITLYGVWILESAEKQVLSHSNLKFT